MMPKTTYLVHNNDVSCTVYTTNLGMPNIKLKCMLPSARLLLELTSREGVDGLITVEM